MQTSQSKIEWPVINMDAAIDALASAHYAVIPNFLSANMQQALHNELLQQQEKGFFMRQGLVEVFSKHEMWIFEVIVFVG